MKKLTEWLIHIERLAGNLYNGAAQKFKDDKKLSDFLKQLAEEEAWHSLIMGNAAAYFANKDVRAAFALDAVTREKIEAPFLDCGQRLQAGALGQEHLVHCVVAAEFSEWNDIFVYVVNSLKEAGQEFAYTAAQMQAHKRFIEKTIESLPNGEVYLKTIRHLSPVWRPRILIVEDDSGVREFLYAVLSQEAEVETAVHGREGLDKLKAKSFDIIISDVNMPVMNGIEFFNAAHQASPHLNERFLFLTGNPTDDLVAFFEQQGVRYLTKPMRIHELEQIVNEICDALPIR
jgi:CheY-like chemotaxis protein